jgi:hypothetical protein
VKDGGERTQGGPFSFAPSLSAVSLGDSPAAFQLQTSSDNFIFFFSFNNSEVIFRGIEGDYVHTGSQFVLYYKLIPYFPELYAWNFPMGTINNSVNINPYLDTF